MKASPLTHPSSYVSFLDEKGAEICLVKDLADLDPTSQELAREALWRFYVVAQIRRVRSLRAEMGVTYWEVETDRGARDFALEDLQENVLDLGAGPILLVDVHGNRHETPDLSRLDQPSRLLVGTVL